jgi:iron(III) transport system ATP-binding protein
MRASVRADVQQICRAAGTTAILVTHDQDEALSMADWIAVLRDGRIVQYASPQDLYTQPADPALARFIGDANLLEGQLAAPAVGVAAGVDTILGRLELEPASKLATTSGPVTVLVRPEQLELIPADAERPPGGQLEPTAGGREAMVAGSAESTGWPAAAVGGQPVDGLTCLAGRVLACEYYGHDAVIRVQPEGQPAGQAIVVRTTGGPQLRTGEAVYVRARGAVIAWAR